MPSPFSQQMLESLNRLTETLGTNSIQSPEFSIQAPNSPKSSGFIENLLHADYASMLRISGWKDPKVLFGGAVILIFVVLIGIRNKIWKTKETRPSIMKIILWTLVIFVPIFLYFFLKK